MAITRAFLREVVQKSIAMEFACILQVLRQPADVAGCHNLEIMLHLLKPTRDACLINKGANALLEAESGCQNWWAKNCQQASTPPTCPNECRRLSFLKNQ